MRDELILRVAAHSGLNEEQARSAIIAVLAGLRRELGRPEAELLADELPDPFAATLRQGHYSATEPLAVRVAATEDVSLVEAMEHVASVCRALAELAPQAVLDRLRNALSDETAALLTPSAPEAHEPHLHPSRNTLSEGRPGSHHPLSEAGPRHGQADSVVESDNPHEETKLSSSHGLTQEREHESLATGRPGARRSLAEADSKCGSK